MLQNDSLVDIIFIDKMLVSCSVCLGIINLFDKEVSILNCGHFFHYNCLNDWLEHQMNCPECRAIITRDNFASNILPKINQETLSHWKSLNDKCGDLEQEKFLLEMENSSLKQS